MDDAVKSPWIIGFGVVSVVHLVLNAADAAPWDSITKCLIAPLLAAWVLQPEGPRLLVAALLFCLGGDLFLEIESLFVVGMASFAAAHICFITFFVQRGALPRLRAKPLALIVYVAAAIAMVIWAWDGLEADVRPFVPVYALLLVGRPRRRWPSTAAPGSAACCSWCPTGSSPSARPAGSTRTRRGTDSSS